MRALPAASITARWKAMSGSTTSGQGAPSGTAERASDAVVMFVGLTRATMGLDRVRPGGDHDPDHHGPERPKFRWLTRPIPRGLVPFWVGIGLDTLDQQPRSVAAVVHGIFFGRVAPSSPQRRAIDVPALVVGHRRDPIHPAADAALLAEELPQAEFLRASSIVEWRARPERLTAAAVEFALRCWDLPPMETLPLEKGDSGTPRRRSRRA